MKVRRAGRLSEGEAATVRLLLRADAVITVAVGAVTLVAAGSIADALSATTTAVRVVGALMLVLGADAFLVSMVGRPRLPAAVVAFVVATELSILALLGVGTTDGLGAADAAVAALLAGAAVIGAVELRAAFRPGRHPTPVVTAA